jgi:NAD(P)-dependent dehydrogenase (short-subunit alcohol dehydrogenase family)
MDEFPGKVAVITGAGRGIGRAIALYCAQQGMHVVLAGIGLESLTTTAAEIEALGVKSLTVQTDVSLLGDVQNLADQSFATFGQVDLLVNNAGVAKPTPLLESTIDDWHWVMGVNFYGVLYGSHTFIPRMARQAAPSYVVNMSSLGGIYPTGGSYSVAKHAVFVLTESLYGELAKTAPHVHICVYCPGWVATEFDQGERSRPPRLSKNVAQLSDEKRVRWRESLAQGVPPAEAARILFAGLAENKLYIGPLAYREQEPRLADAVRMRMENILNERNP